MSHAQNQTVMRIVARSAAEYANAGYFTIVDGIVIPRLLLEPLRDALHAAGHGPMARTLAIWGADSASARKRRHRD